MRLFTKNGSSVLEATPASPVRCAAKHQSCREGNVTTAHSRRGSIRHRDGGERVWLLCRAAVLSSDAGLDRSARFARRSGLS